ncbi:MAG: hypothetical protein QGH89_02800 [Candidatus Marinimicrobia bacterium]|nr:hypothetical protein [Candidatus Neomarinimicrobiota bacterium]
MNVKKEQLREDIRTFISEHPNSDIRTIAEHFDLQKHSLYYHMKILLKDDVISVTHTEIVNGIDKKYYSSVRQTPAQAPDRPQNAANSGTAEAAAVSAPKPAAPADVEATHPEEPAAAPENTVSDVKKPAKKEDSIDDQAATLSNLLLNVKNSDSAPPEKPAESSPEPVQTAPQELPAEQPQKQQNKPVEEASKAPAEKPPKKELIEPQPAEPKAGKAPQQTIIQDLTKNKTAKKKKFNIKFNPNINLSSLFKRKKKKKKTKTLSERYQKWAAGMRERNVFNLDIFDTFRSRSLLISRNAIISFENKENQNTFQIIDKEQLPDLINNKRNRIAVIDEDLLDNHEKVQSPLKKKNDQELFLNKFITRKYGISTNDLFLTYEVFGTDEKNEFELNTIFTKKSYIDPFLDLLDTEEIPANIYFMSFAGIFSRYNQQILKDHNYNLYVYAGKKDCVVTLLYRGKILSHRKILISNRGLDRKTYKREVHNRLIKTIDIFIQEYAVIDETFTALDQILFCGPNLSKDIVDEVSDKFKVSCNLIEGSFPSSGDEGNFNDYIPTLKFISRSLAKLGKNQYVFDQSKKKLFRLNRIKKVVAYASLALLLLLSGLNVNVYERKTASAFVLNTQTDAVNATIDLIKNVENTLQKNIQLSHFDNYLNNIHTNKQNVKKILLLMNSDIFKHLEIRNIKIETTGHEEIDAKKQKIYLSGTINDYKPEALLETQNIQNALSDIGYLTNVELNTLNYAQGRLPLNITMEIGN